MENRCPKCRHANPDNHKFCAKCGGKLNTLSNTTSARKVASSPVKKNNSTAWSIVCGVALWALIQAGGAVKNSISTPTPTPHAQVALTATSSPSVVTPYHPPTTEATLPEDEDMFAHPTPLSPQQANAIATQIAKAPKSVSVQRDFSSASSLHDSIIAARKQGLVWVNTDSGIYHFSNSQWYGTTNEGYFTTEAEAKSHGYRAAFK